MPRAVPGSTMNVLLLGAGGREHALAWKLRQSRRLTRLYAAPGNPGIAAHAEIVGLDVADHAAVAAFCRRMDIGLVVVGPEGPLAAGIADDLSQAGIAVFGPSQTLQHGWNRRKASPRTSPPRRASPPPPTPASAMPRLPRRMCAGGVLRSSSRLTAWPLAKV